MCCSVKKPRYFRAEQEAAEPDAAEAANRLQQEALLKAREGTGEEKHLVSICPGLVSMPPALINPDRAHVTDEAHAGRGEPAAGVPSPGRSPAARWGAAPGGCGSPRPWSATPGTPSAAPQRTGCAVGGRMGRQVWFKKE